MWTPAYKSAFKESLTMNYSKSDSILENQSEVIASTEYYIKSINYLIKLFLTETNKSNSTTDSLSYYYNKIDDSDIDTPWNKYYNIEILMMQSLLNAKLGNNIKSAYDTYKAVKKTKSFLEDYPNFHPTYALYGLQLCTFSKIPNNLKGLSSLLGLNGDYDNGIKQIEKSIEKCNTDEFDFLRDKEKFFHIFASKEFGEVDSIRISDEINDYDENPILIYYQAYLMSGDSEIEGAIQFLLDSENKWKHRLNYLNYFLGKLLTYEIDDRAPLYINKFIDNSATSLYKKAAYLNLGYLALINNNVEEYERYKALILKENEGEILTPSDKASISKAKNLTNPTLIKSDLLFSAGKYDEALNTISSKDRNELCKDIFDNIFYYYRLASIYKKLEKDDLAILNFKRCISFKTQTEFHYQPNSYVLLGEIYIKQKDFDKAEEALEKCLDIKDFPYSYSIHNRAKFLLESIDD